MWRYRFQSPPPSQYSLSHYGIQGQKWGIRRFQYENGSYTPEGKERYGRGSGNGLTGGFFKKKYKPPFEVDKKAVERDFDASVDEHRDIANRIEKNGEKLVDQANRLSESYEKHLSSMKLTKQNRENVWDGLRIDFGNDGTEDEELYELAVRDRVYEEVDRSLRTQLPKNLKAEREAFDRNLKQYWKDVHAISDPILNKYKDKYLKDLEDRQESWDPVDLEINKLIGEKLGTRFIAYLNNHFDDYWVRDTADFNKAVMRLEDEFPYEEYEKRLREK